MKKQTRIYLISVAISLGAGIISALLTSVNMDIYEEISTPPLSPPSFLFPVVWTVLYILMGVSAAMVLNTGNSPLTKRKEALYIYGLSLFFNFLWSVIFFNLRAFLFSLVWIIALLAFIIATIVKYYKINKTASYLQIPYALWVVFATYLNAGILILNR